ncbi:uncharacterized protein DC041_0004910 [Schistosoma bovis]|uniref:Uncharacterized protein n=1 Tax=Schistosoma bovis TaxID=6184 RepID=A0A430QLK5_SCHBO|nr:uncharacterized protein DC041_0004910 [Schistosoma bovis]
MLLILITLILSILFIRSTTITTNSYSTGNDDIHNQLEKWFTKLTTEDGHIGPPVVGTISTYGRVVTFKQTGGNILKCTFDELCNVDHPTNMKASIFTGDEDLFAYSRTLSRLREMRSKLYWDQSGPNRKVD